MKILGKGLYGVVMQDGRDTVKKFYRGREGWEKEVGALQFLADLQRQGFDIGCKIPRLLESAEGGPWRVDDRPYNFYTIMDFVAGVRANQDFPGKDCKILGEHLGTILFNMHSRSRAYIDQWISQKGERDKLFYHILTEKAEMVLAEEKDEIIRGYAAMAARYLRDRQALLAADRTISHTDLNLNNIMANRENKVEGLVDWGDLGFTNPCLTLYQLATAPYLWTHVRRQYKKLGGTIMDDVVYAAAIIHLTWAPIRLRQLGLPVGPDDSPERLEEIYGLFNKSASGL
jgi:hypothetical protein